MLSFTSMQSPSVTPPQVEKDFPRNTSEPVLLNVYDLLSDYRAVNCLVNRCACRLLGVYHTSVQIYNVEYYFGDGICKCRPHCHVGRLIVSEKVGTTDMTMEEIETSILFDMYEKFTRKDYDLLRHNCNHFTNAFLNRLLGISLPVRFNRAERCLLATPCCTRTLNCILGSDWTRPGLGLKTVPNEKQKACCHRKSRT